MAGKYRDEELEAALEAERRRTADARVRTGLGGVSDALGAAFTRRPAPAERPMPEGPGAMDVYALRQRASQQGEERARRARYEDPASEDSKRFRSVIASLAPEYWEAIPEAERNLVSRSDEDVVWDAAKLRAQVANRKPPKSPEQMQLDEDLKRAELQRRRAEAASYGGSQDLKNQLVREQIEELRRRPGEKEKDREATATRVETKAAQVDEKLVQDLATRMSDAGPLLRDIQALERYQYDDDIPGVGRVASRLPEEALSAEGGEVRGRVFGIVNRLLKLQSGSAVSEGEVKRKMAELGMGTGMAEESFRNGLKRLGEEYRTAVQEAMTRHKPEVVEEWKRRGNTAPGGVQYQRPASRSAPSAPATPPAAAPSPAPAASQGKLTPGGKPYARKQYSASRDATRYVDEAGNVVEVANGRQ